MSRKVSQNNNNAYSYLHDPHLFYHLESPNKVQELLNTGLFELHERNLIEISTLDSFKLSQFTYMRVPDKYKQNNKQKSLRVTYSSSSNNNNNDETQYKQQRKSENKFMTTNASRLSSHQSKQNKQGKQKVIQNGMHIKGLMQFRKKIL